MHYAIPQEAHYAVPLSLRTTTHGLQDKENHLYMEVWWPGVLFYVRGVKDKWHITRKQIGFCISPEMGQVLWPAPFSGLLNIQEVSLCERLSGVAICSMQT